jgi:hypothetical protein
VVSILESPRMRRRLVRVGAVALVGAVVAIVAVVLPNTSGHVKAHFSNQPVQRVIRERQVPVTPKRRAEVNALFDDFVPDAVERRDPGAAYDLVTPLFRAGTSRSSWREGDLPVYPYEARGGSFHGWTVDSSFRDAMSVELYLQPRNPKNGAVAANVDLRRLHGRWLIDSFYPRTSYAPARSASPTTASRSTSTQTPRVAAAPLEGSAHNGLMWALILAFVSLVLLTPVAIVTWSWARTRRSRRRSV